MRSLEETIDTWYNITNFTACKPLIGKANNRKKLSSRDSPYKLTTAHPLSDSSVSFKRGRVRPC